MTSVLPGASTLDVEVTNVSTHGWLMLGAEELFVPFSEFPWFKDAPIAKLTNVERPQPHHLYWPDLDVVWPSNRSAIPTSSRWSQDPESERRVTPAPPRTQPFLPASIT